MIVGTISISDIGTTRPQGFSMPRFSVLLPTHNRAGVIGFAIQSVLAQTEADFELFVVGDGCTDETADVVAQYKDDRIRWFDFPKAPLSGYANRNSALRHAQGDLVAYAQDDDLMLPDHLALTGEMMKSGIDWAYTRPLWVTTDGVIVPYGTNLMIADELTYFLEANNTIPSNCVVHRRKCLDRFGYWPEDAPHIGDWLLWRKIIRGCGSEGIAFLPTPTTLHFSSAWKKSRHAGVQEVLTWLGIADRAEWWPPVLRHSVPGPGQEQRIVFEALENGGAAFVSKLREATATVINRQAWDGIRRLMPGLAEMERQLAQKDASLRMATQAAVRLQTRLDAVLASRTWRVMEPARRLGKLLARLPARGA
jgi:Glycosyl transferase family 2